MSAHEIRVDYQELERAGAVFADFADRIHAVYNRLSGHMDTLRRNKWIGENADQFYREMEFHVLPAIRRVVESLDEANNITKETIHIFENAEEDAGAVFPTS